MTTVAWRFPHMACDGRVTDGTQIASEKFEKITRLACGGLLGLAGDADCRAVIELFDRVKSGRALPTGKALMEVSTDFAGILALPDGTVWCVEAAQPENSEKRATSCIIPIEGHYAIGSGGKFAKAAMDMGASAERSVRIAIKNDSASGGRVYVHELLLKRRRGNSRAP